MFFNCLLLLLVIAVVITAFVQKYISHMELFWHFTYSLKTPSSTNAGLLYYR